MKSIYTQENVDQTYDLYIVKKKSEIGITPTILHPSPHKVKNSSACQIHSCAIYLEMLMTLLSNNFLQHEKPQLTNETNQHSWWLLGPHQFTCNIKLQEFILLD